MQDFGFFAIETIVKIIVIMAACSAVAGFTTVIERKVLGFMQNRYGPMTVGYHGLGVILADAIKMFTKEDIIPQNVLKPTFVIAPIIGIATALLAMSAIPFFPEFVLFGHTIRPIVADINVGVLFVLGVMSCGMYSPLLAGISSRNKWALLGAARTIIQMLSFEVVGGFALLGTIMLVGSLSLIDINNYQNGGISEWLVFKQPVACVLFLMAAYAETNRTPFDLLEHEAEVVSGYCTEYSGLRWGLFFVGEYVNMLTAALLVSLIFFGGFNSIGFIPGGIAILLKVGFFIFLFLWARAAWPHIRPDQLMWVCWKVLMPIAVVNIIITGFVLLQ